MSNNTGEKSILIGIPSMREDDKFFSSVLSLIASCKNKYNISLIVEKWQDLAEAQNKITDYFLQNKFDYLLFLDDDVYGHTVEMLDALVNADADVSSINAYQRRFPHPSLLCTVGNENTSGYHPFFLTGFQMCLIRRVTFSLLRKPYFIGQYNVATAWATDQTFFFRLKTAEAKMIGCWDFCLNHAGITKENVSEMREKNVPSYLDKVLALKKRGDLCL